MPNSASTATAALPNKTWASMNRNERAVFVLKVCIMVCSGGFIFANILADDIVPTDSAG